MSVLIKGGITIEELQSVMLMFKGHEIIELPDHGDLIDRDALKGKTEFIGDAFSGRGGFAVWGDDVLDAPVVIPAERSEE